MTGITARRLVEALPPRVGFRLRGEKNRRELHGLAAPGTFLTDLVPRGCTAVDIGAARGLYTYWIAKAARHVWAFEPNPDLYGLVAAGAGSNVTAVNVALSDRAGTARLTVPEVGEGEASLEIDPTSGPGFDVETATLDSFDLGPVGFAKIDVEGHELAVLRGAERTLADRPVIFIELEDRHRPGTIKEATALLMDGHGYGRAEFMWRGALHPLDAFDPAVHQSPDAARSSGEYVSNFLFRP